MNYYLFITGCQQNVYDAQKITHLLEKVGYFESEEKYADIIIVLACSVRQKPVDRIFGKLRIWKKLPQKPKIILTGCVLPHNKKLLLSKIDYFIPQNNFKKNLTEILLKYFPKNCDSVNWESNNKKITAKKNKNNNGFVPIMYGCDNFCSYCVVPYTRGRETSRSEREIIGEIKEKVNKGIAEITLLGQNVNSYKSFKHLNIKTLKHKSDFVRLLNRIENIKGLNKISFLTSHPKDMSDDLIGWMAKSKKFSRELHLPVQSGDNKILRKMNRRYAVEDYIKLVEKIREKISAKGGSAFCGKNLKLSTDIIVGFPGETKKQFENTVKLCKKINFDMAYVSQYSPRIGTAAAKLPDDVTKAEKKRRWLVLNNLINKKGINL